MNSEQYLCGAILIDGAQVLSAIRGILPAGAFQYDEYRAVYTAGLSLLDAGEPVDPVSIKAQAKRQGVELTNQLLTELMEIVPTTANCVDYAHRVAEEARTRAVKELAERIQSDTVSSADELLATLQRETEAAATSEGYSPRAIRSAASWITLCRLEKNVTTSFPQVSRDWTAF